MNTKYILHGGRKPDSAYSKDFFEELTRDIPQKNITILYVPFAKEKALWKKEYAEKIKMFTQAYPTKKVTVLLADDKAETFLDQTHEANIIFNSGGNDLLLMDFYSKIPLSVLLEHFKNKTIVGTSAGANTLAKYYYTNNRQQIEEGLGVLPIKTFCHYTEEKEQLLENLEAYGEQLTSFALPEDYFVIIQ